MLKKRILSLILCLTMLGSCLPCRFVFADNGAKNERTVYLHAQGDSPDGTDRSEVYMGEDTEVYLAIDNPNKGDYDEATKTHKEPQYDLNGYTVTIYFDPAYFDYASDTKKPIDYTVPDKNIDTSDMDTEKGEDVPTTVGYYPYRQGSSADNGYKTAYVTVFYNGGFVPQKQDGQTWYNLCKLPLKPLKTGSTQIFIDTSSGEGGLELFAKNNSEKLEDQTFLYTAVNGGSHTIVIKDKSRPSVPTASPNAGSYDEKQTVALTAEDGCDIYYSTDGTSFEKYTSPIEIETTTKITCYAVRTSDSKKSNNVSYEYNILPKAPRLFDDGKTPIPNVYTSDDIFTVYAADKASYGTIEDINEIYYTFSDISADSITPGTDPESEWVKLEKRAQSIEINKNCTVRLVTCRMGTLYSDVSEYRLGIRPAAVTASPDSGSYDEKQDITLSTATTGAKIYYTTDGSDPKTNGIEYSGVITLAKDATVRAVAYYDGIYSDVSSFYYLFTSKDDFGVDAFYPSGVYEGSVNVTLTANNPENKIEYSTDGGINWLPYENTLVIDKDTVILARAVDKDGNESSAYYTFTYKIKPLPPVFAPESTQFTGADKMTVYCVESNKDNTSRFKLFYTLDGSDPTTSSSRFEADSEKDSAEIQITKYTVVKAAVLKDGVTYSSVVTHSYDIVSKKPSRPLMTLTPGNYTRKIGDDVGFSTQFMPVPTGTEIYYTISYDGTFTADPIPNTDGTIQYDGNPITVKGRTIIKAVAVNAFGVKSDVGIFEYTVAPEAPKAAPSAVIGSDTLPVVPVSAVKGCTVKYDIGGFENEFICEDGSFYIDTATGNAYKDEACTESLGTRNAGTITAPATLNISAELDGIESAENRYTYSLQAGTVAPPYADKETGEYEEIKADDDNNLLLIKLYSLNNGDTIQYTTDNGVNWFNYTGTIKIKNDTVLQIRSEKDGKYSSAVSYVYNFVPLAPIITLESGRYLKSDNKTTEIKYDDRAPQDKIANDYKIMYRENGDKQDYPYSAEREIDHTMSFKAYVINTKTGRTSKNTIHYYIIEPESAATGSVYVANPYDVSRISADVLDTGEYAKGIKLLTQKNNAEILYYYTYTQEDGNSITTPILVYDNVPITVNTSMTGITITAWLTDTDGNEILGSKETFPIEFVHLKVPETSLGSDKVEFPKKTAYTIKNDYPDDENILIYYTLDGSDPSIESNANRKLYNGESLSLTAAVTVKTVYMSACGKCVYCKDDRKELCTDKVYGKTGVYKYTVPTVINSGGGGGSGKTTTVDNTRKYTKDIFGNEHPTHIGYINGYPDGSVKPDGEITREEITSILYRIVNHDYEKPFVAAGDKFPDVSESRWSAHDIEYMSDKNIVYGYPDGEFKPGNNLTRAEFAALIRRFAKLDATETENPFPDLDKSHWAYEDILALNASGLMQGYEDGTYRPENRITRAEVMTVINKILGRNPSEPYVKSLDFNPFNDLEKDKWHYTIVLEATITHNYYLDDDGLEIKWEDCK